MMVLNLEMSLFDYWKCPKGEKKWFPGVENDVYDTASQTDLFYCILQSSNNPKK